MFEVSIEAHWQLSRQTGEAFDAHPLLRLLTLVEQHASIAQAARELGLSYRHAWGLVQQSEARLGAKLLETQRGRGAELTRFAQVLLWADKRVAARLSPTLQSLASELAVELARLAEQDQAQAQPALRLQASHGFAVAALLEQMATERRPVELSYRNSSEAVAALSRRECDMAGFHVPLGEFQPAAVALYARWLDAERHVLVNLAVRNQGLFLAPGNPKRVRRLQDLVQSNVRFVNRQDGSGTRLLIDLLLAKAKLAHERIQGYDTHEFTHAAIAAHVASGMADAGIGVETAARRFGLDFIPLVRERYFFAVEQKALANTPLSEVVAILQSASFRERVNSLAGYDAKDTGRIETLAQAFGPRLRRDS